MSDLPAEYVGHKQLDVYVDPQQLQGLKDEIYRMYISGVAVEEISKHFDRQSAEILEWIQDALELAAKHRKALQTEVLEAEIARLEGIMVVLTDSIKTFKANGKVDHTSIAQLLVIQEKKAKYLGLYSSKSVDQGLKLEDILSDD